MGLLIRLVGAAISFSLLAGYFKMCLIALKGQRPVVSMVFSQVRRLPTIFGVVDSIGVIPLLGCDFLFAAASSSAQLLPWVGSEENLALAMLVVVFIEIVFYALVILPAIVLVWPLCVEREDLGSLGLLLETLRLVRGQRLKRFGLVFLLPFVMALGVIVPVVGTVVSMAYAAFALATCYRALQSEAHKPFGL